MSLKEQLAEYRAGWYHAFRLSGKLYERHIDQLRTGSLADKILTVGDHAPAIVLTNANGATVDVGTLLRKGPSSSPSIAAAGAHFEPGTEGISADPA